MRYEILVKKIKCDFCSKNIGKNRVLKADKLDFCDKFCKSNFDKREKNQQKMF